MESTYVQTDPFCLKTSLLQSLPRVHLAHSSTRLLVCTVQFLWCMSVRHSGISFDNFYSMIKHTQVCIFTEWICVTAWKSCFVHKTIQRCLGSIQCFICIAPSIKTPYFKNNEKSYSILRSAGEWGPIIFNRYMSLLTIITTITPS